MWAGERMIWLKRDVVQHYKIQQFCKREIRFLKWKMNAFKSGPYI